MFYSKTDLKGRPCQSIGYVLRDPIFALKKPGQTTNDRTQTPEAATHERNSRWMAELAGTYHDNPRTHRRPRPWDERTYIRCRNLLPRGRPMRNKLIRLPPTLLPQTNQAAELTAITVATEENNGIPALYIESDSRWSSVPLSLPSEIGKEKLCSHGSNGSKVIPDTQETKERTKWQT